MDDKSCDNYKYIGHCTITANIGRIFKYADLICEKFEADNKLKRRVKKCIEKIYGNV